MTLAEELGKIAYEARFEHLRRENDKLTWEELPRDAQATWMRVAAKVTMRVVGVARSMGGVDGIRNEIGKEDKP